MKHDGVEGGGRDVFFLKSTWGEETKNNYKEIEEAADFRGFHGC